MTGKWHTLTVDQIKATDDGAISIGPFGSRLKTDRYVADGIPVVRGNNISDTREFTGEFVFVTPETADELGSSNVFPGDLVFPHRGAIGRVGIVQTRARDSGSKGRFLLSTSLMKLTCNRMIVDPVFVFYFFRSRYGRDALLQHSSTVGTPGIGQPLASLRSISLPVPPLPEQNAIAHILATLDDKIELNRRMNEALEAMARALFKSWFVDFDPVRAKMEGRWQSGQSLPGLPAHLYGLFPNRLAPSELGEVPEGWRIRGIDDLVSLSRQSVNPRAFPDEIFDHYSIPAYDEGCMPRAETGMSIKSNKYPVLPNCVLLSKLNPRIPRVWFPTLSPTRRSVCSTEFLVLRPKPKCTREYLYYLFRSSMFMNEFATLVTGTSGSHQRVRPQALLNLSVVAPLTHPLRAFTSKVSGILSRVANSRKECQILAALRDTLLPKLISGELRLKDAEHILGRAV